MVTGRLMASARRQEWAARLLVLFLVGATPLAIFAAGRQENDTLILHAAMPESGGWQPDHLSARAGEPLHLRLTSNDVVHSFAVAKQDMSPVDVEPGKVTALTLLFDKPGTYTFYCTRWCGANHWRMRGTIEVSGETTGDSNEAGPPLYVQLGLDIDAPHPAKVTPARTPSAARGASLDLAIGEVLLGPEAYMSKSPIDVWLALRDAPELAHLDDAALWDAVAYGWRQKTSAPALALGAALYSQNCAACHGENGAGDGIFAQAGETATNGLLGHSVEPPTNFRDPALLAASNALMQGKILRGGMGTGMPAWGAILTDAELQALLDYLWTFQFPVDD